MGPDRIDENGEHGYNRCPLCGAGEFARPHPDQHPWLARCPGCDLLFANPQPSDQALEQIYDEHYYGQFGFQEADRAAHAGLSRMKQATYRLMLSKAEPFTDREAGNRLLDVGCGLGFSLLAARARGWEPFGLDPAGAKVAGGVHELSERIRSGTLDSFTPDRPFDLVSLVDVIEHVRDPVETIRRAASLLTPDGALLLATNNSAGFQARRAGAGWVHLHRAHLWYFTPETLAQAAERAGLSVRRVERTWRVYNLDYVCSILANSNQAPLMQKISKWILRWVPRPVRLIPWPPLPEGMVLIATKPETTRKG